MLHLFVYLTCFYCSDVHWGAFSNSRLKCETLTTLNTYSYNIQSKYNIKKYSKKHENVCVYQMCVIFIHKIKDYFSSNKADVPTYVWTVH